MAIEDGPATHGAESEIVPDKHHHDKANLFGMKLPREIPSTKSSIQKGTVGRDPVDAKLKDFLVHRETSYARRLVGNGRFVIFEAYRCLDVCHFAHALLAARDDRKEHGQGARGFRQLNRSEASNPGERCRQNRILL